MQNKIFYTICAGFLLGVFVRSFLAVNLYLVFLLALISMGLFLFSFLITRNSLIILFAAFSLIFSVGVIRFHISDEAYPRVFEDRLDQKSIFSGIIIDDPEVKESNEKLVVEINEKKEKTKILITTSIHDKFKYGDGIKFSGKLEKPKNFTTDQGKVFDYLNYLRKDGILYVMDYPKIEIASHGNGNFVKSALFAVKNSFLKNLNSVIPKPESLLIGGLILGEKSAFDKNLQQDLINTGTIHMVALSGYNVTIVAEWIMKIFSFLPRNFGIGTGIFSILLFILMTGASSTAIRAGIMAVLALIARTTGRDYDVARTLLFAGVIMVLSNPLILVFDVSFQLSFIATVAVIILSPKIEKYFFWIKYPWLRDLVSITAAAYIFVLPFILYKMGNLSLAALPTNVLILPFIPATMLSGFAAGLFGFISPIISAPFVYLAYGLLHYELYTVKALANLPFAVMIIKNFPLILIVIIYTLFAYYLFSSQNSSKDKEECKNTWEPFKLKNLQSPIFTGIVVLAMIVSGFLYYGHFAKNTVAGDKLRVLLSANALGAKVLSQREKKDDCQIRGPLPDSLCSPGAVFANATSEIICVKGYTRTVRNVSTKTRKKVYAEYGVSYPQERGAYEVDHLIPLELGGSNDIANLFLEAAEPFPGFKEKDLVENFLNHEVCAGRADLAAAQYQIATDWTQIYYHLTPEQISVLKQEYRSWAGN